MAKLVLPLLLALLFGCSASKPVGGSAQADAPVGKNWVLRELDGAPVKRANPEAATIRLDADGRIAGTSACNDVGGEELTWTADASGRSGSIERNQLGTMVTTVVGCWDARAIASGDRFWTQMRNARSWSANATTLTIRFSDGSAAMLASGPRAVASPQAQP